MSEKNLVFLHSRPKMLSPNQIAVFFDHQYRWKESIITLDLLYGDNHEGKLRSDTTTLSWIWSLVLIWSLVQSNCSSVNLRENSCYSLKIELKEKAEGRYLDHLLPLITFHHNEYGFQCVE